ncbi:hypothetical protein [Paenibacillus polymyxa]|uniref:hypothetical protein n=1 Tax=Paenibacillus polymyxa TaxID=1406 RepID=UPI0015D5B82D|nr:hypothetical protein [Paenibacillus polymyxa]
MANDHVEKAYGSEQMRHLFQQLETAQILTIEDSQQLETAQILTIEDSQELATK